MKKKLLLISMSAGAGHTRAAEALRKTVGHYFPSVEATHIDMANYVKLPMKMAVLRSYDLMIKELPGLWGFLYKKTDNPSLLRRFRKISTSINRMNATLLYEYVRNERPDYILTTHFLPAQALLQSKDKATLPPIGLVLTDYDRHALLMQDGMKNYFVATERMKTKMTWAGITASAITATGIPLDPIFYHVPEKPALMKKYGFDTAKPILVILSGGQGLSHIEALVPALFKTALPCTIVAIAGSNTSLEEKLKQLRAPAHIDFHAVGWTDHIEEYLFLAGAVVSKPGGLTTTECLELGAPLIAYQPIPGQEEWNAEYILERNAGRIAHDPEDVRYYAEQYLTGKISRPLRQRFNVEEGAAFQILKKIFEN